MAKETSYVSRRGLYTNTNLNHVNYFSVRIVRAFTIKQQCW